MRKVTSQVVRGMRFYYVLRFWPGTSAGGTGSGTESQIILQDENWGVEKSGGTGRENRVERKRDEIPRPQREDSEGRCITHVSF